MNTTSNQILLELKSVTHKYGGVTSLHDICLNVTKGEIIALLGPSGCGKSTLLRIIAGLDNISSGQVSIGGSIFTGPGTMIPPEQRGVGLVFQDCALFPHLSVLKNILFGIRHTGDHPESKIAYARQLLHKVGLSHKENDMPHMLSGGEQQRIALIRALAPKPQLILLDEPFSGLDSSTRIAVRDQTLALLKESQTTVILVTHDPIEAMSLAERIVVMNAGCIEQQGTPESVYLYPISPFVACFMAPVNTICTRLTINNSGEYGFCLGDTKIQLDTDRVPSGLVHDSAMQVLIRPEGIRLIDANDDVGHNANAPAKIQNIQWRGAYVHVTLLLQGLSTNIHANINSTEWIKLTKRKKNMPSCYIEIDPGSIHVFKSS